MKKKEKDEPRGGHDSNEQNRNNQRPQPRRQVVNNVLEGPIVAVGAFRNLENIFKLGK